MNIASLLRSAGRTGRALAAVLALAGGAGVCALAADEYRFFLVDHLSETETLTANVDKPVKFVDKLVRIWAFQKDGEPIRFDTGHFRCAVPADKSEDIALIRELMKLQDGVDKTPEAAPPLVAVSGTVVRNPLFGKPKDEAKGAGREEDELIILVDRIEKPRARFAEEGY